MSAHEQLTCHSDDRGVDTTTNHQPPVSCTENEPLVLTESLELANHDNAAHYADGDSHTRGNADDEAVSTVGAGTEKTKKKKKKSKSRKKRKPITGFEEFYADGPLTPSEAIYEQEELYSPNRLFIDRIEECIQRYRARRRMDPEQTFMFNKYMFLGGVDSEQRQFTGIAEDIERLAALGEDKDGLRVATARDFVGNAGSRFYEPGSEGWVVDFEGVVKGFLSRTITDLYLYDDVAIDKAASLIKNFLNYVLTHDVCPEHRPGVLAARHICDVAPIELRAAHELANKLPGAFHQAVAAVAAATAAATVANEDDKVDKNLALVKIVLATTAGFEDMALAMNEPGMSLKTNREREQTYVVTAVHRPVRAARQAFLAKLASLDTSQLENGSGNDNSSDVSKDSDSEGGGDEDAAGIDDGDVVSMTNAGPAGTITLRPSHIDGGYDNVPIATTTTTTTTITDSTDEGGEEESYVLEDSLLRLCEVGMKLQLVVSEVELVTPPTPSTTPTHLATITSTATTDNNSNTTVTSAAIAGGAPAQQQQKLRVIKACADVRVSFDTFLPQMLMARWKDPVENTRPPPSVHNPHADFAEGEDGEGGEGDAAGGGGGGSAAAAAKDGT